MTVATSSSWNPAVTEICRQAMINIGAIADDETPTAAMFDSALFALNGIVKTAEATGLHVWTEEEAILFIQPGQVRYVIGDPDPTLNAHTADANEWLYLLLGSNAGAGATTLTLSAAAPIPINSHVGLVLNNGLTFWTTASAASSGVTVSLTDPVPASGATAGAVVIDYVTPITRPLKVPNARLLTLLGDPAPQGPNETPMTIMSRQEYMDTPNKLSPGTPTQWFYSPRRDQGLFYIWPAAQRSAWAIRFTWYRPLRDLLTPNNTVDFPQEWVLPLTWWLAEDIAIGYDCPPARYALVKQKSGEYRELVENYDRESEPVEFGLDYRYR